MPFCFNCGIEMKQEEKYCANCGSPQEDMKMIYHEQQNVTPSRRPAIHFILLLLGFMIIGGGIAAILMLPENTFTISNFSNQFEDKETTDKQNHDTKHLLKAKK